VPRVLPFRRRRLVLVIEAPTSTNWLSSLSLSLIPSSSAPLALLLLAIRLLVLEGAEAERSAPPGMLVVEGCCALYSYIYVESITGLDDDDWDIDFFFAHFISK
jgi:hypothetical protein